MDSVKSAARTLDILELLAAHPQGLLLVEIGKALNIPLSSIHALLNTLEARKYIYRDDELMKYHIGWKLVGLTSQFNATQEITRVASAVIAEKLLPCCRETVTLSVLDGRDILFIYSTRDQGKDGLQVINTAGQKLPAYATASGRALMAYLTEAQINQIYPEENFQQLTPKTRTSKQEFIAEIRLHRARGYWFDDEESESGIWAVATAILGPQGTPLAAMSIVAPRVRASQADQTRWVQTLLDCATEVNRRLK